MLMRRNLKRRQLAGLAGVTVLAAGLVTSTAQAGESERSTSAAESPDVTLEVTVVDLATWNYAPLYDGWRADDLMHSADIVDRNGENIGHLEDLIMGSDGKVKKLVIDSGGFLGIGDTHFAYPWKQAKIVEEDKIEVMLDERRLEDYSFFVDIEDEPAEGKNWRLSELLNDYAYLKGNVPYGVVDDVVLNRDGELMAVIVYPDVRYGTYGPHAWPYYGAMQARDGIYEIPHDIDEVAELKVFISKEPDEAS